MVPRTDLCKQRSQTCNYWTFLPCWWTIKRCSCCVLYINVVCFKGDSAVGAGKQVEHNSGGWMHSKQRTGVFLSFPSCRLQSNDISCSFLPPQGTYCTVLNLLRHLLPLHLHMNHHRMHHGMNYSSVPDVFCKTAAGMTLEILKVRNSDSDSDLSRGWLWRDVPRSLRSRLRRDVK